MTIFQAHRFRVFNKLEAQVSSSCLNYVPSREKAVASSVSSVEHGFCSLFISNLCGVRQRRVYGTSLHTHLFRQPPREGVEVDAGVAAGKVVAAVDLGEKQKQWQGKSRT